MKEFWLSLTQDNQVAILTTLATVLSIFVGAGISIWQIRVTKQREIEERVHEQRKERYEQLLNIVQEILVNTTNIQRGQLPFDRKKWLDLQFGMATYASTEVYQKYIEFRQTAERLDKIKNQGKKPDGMALVVLLGKIVLLMRKEVGLAEGNINVRDFLSTFINDINDPEYDYLFEKVS